MDDGVLDRVERRVAPFEATGPPGHTRMQTTGSLKRSRGIAAPSPFAFPSPLPSPVSSPFAIVGPRARPRSQSGITNLDPTYLRV
ncbi:hypothetical protein GCM10009000_056570 [Halobacterium noricense]